MISFDTNIVVHSANADSPLHGQARSLLEDLACKTNVIVCELMLVEVFLKLCNHRIFQSPMSAVDAGRYCQSIRNNRNWRLLEHVEVMSEVWQWTTKPGFAFRRIIDVRLGLTLRKAGVTEFATTNTKDFHDLGFDKVWNPFQ